MKVQLANTYSPIKNYGVKFWHASPKLDGIRAVHSDEGLLTRQGKPIFGLGEIEKELSALREKYGWSFIDGELVISGKSFQAMQGTIMAQEHEDKHKVEFYAFAVGGDFEFTSNMLAELTKISSSKVKSVASVRVETVKQVSSACSEFIARGYEGIMLRHPVVSYSAGRGNYLLKYKPFKEADLKIVDIINGKGALKGKIGSVIAEGKIGDIPVRVGVGSGFTLEDRNVLSGDDVLGKVLSVQYQSITDVPDKDGFFSLRFPVGLGIKIDR